jgi:hypothetical protein
MRNQKKEKIETKEQNKKTKHRTAKKNNTVPIERITMTISKKERSQSKSPGLQNNRSKSEAREKPKNVKNLKPVRDKKEAEEIGKKGGLASGQSRREKRNFQQACRWFLETKSKDGLTNLEKIVMTQGNLALEGNIQSAVFIRDTAGEKPKDKMEIEEVNKKPIKIEIVD